MLNPFSFFIIRALRQAPFEKKAKSVNNSPVIGIWKRASINRKIRKKKSCLSAASSFLLGFEIVIDR
jgi:hypothetical protein